MRTRKEMEHGAIQGMVYVRNGFRENSTFLDKSHDTIAVVVAIGHSIIRIQDTQGPPGVNIIKLGMSILNTNL